MCWNNILATLMTRIYNLNVVKTAYFLRIQQNRIQKKKKQSSKLYSIRKISLLKTGWYEEIV